jgi:hypothetical protein
MYSDSITFLVLAVLLCVVVLCGATLIADCVKPMVDGLNVAATACK